MIFSLAEKIVLALLIAASLTGFWVRLGPVVRIIRAAKPDAGFHLGAMGPRVRRFVWEVLLQGKVIKDMLSWIVKSGEGEVSALSYAPLPQNVAEKVLKTVYSLQ